MARDAVEVTYHKLHYFLTEATWSAEKINERRLEMMNIASFIVCWLKQYGQFKFLPIDRYEIFLQLHYLSTHIN